MIKPLGVYGSKVGIVRLLRSINIVSEDLARLLLSPTEVGGSRPTLSSGLYIVAGGPVGPSEERHYVIYWPEDSTWDDSAASSVSRNRVTFMRYLTKICDQVVAILSSKHSASIVWDDKDNDSSDTESVETGDPDRLVTFVVEKTDDQEDGAKLRPDESRDISSYEIPAECSPDVDPSIFIPRLLHGETTQAFSTVTYIPRRILWKEFDHRPISRMLLEQMLSENALVLSESLDEKAVKILVDVALSKRFPEQCSKLNAVRRDIREDSHKEMKRKQRLFCQGLQDEERALWSTLESLLLTTW
ncbi:hypothetical protein BGW80DRAFT_1468366 [Lactifluus volemus]|nr:hypothetical protein BGW80DRAFT_1468366 [Lactifluus volemus]